MLRIPVLSKLQHITSKYKSCQLLVVLQVASLSRNSMAHCTNRFILLLLLLLLLLLFIAIGLHMVAAVLTLVTNKYKYT